MKAESSLGLPKKPPAKSNYRVGRTTVSFRLADELVTRAQRESESRGVPLTVLFARALHEYLDVLDSVDRTPVAFKSGLPRKRMLLNPADPDMAKQPVPTREDKRTHRRKVKVPADAPKKGEPDR